MPFEKAMGACVKADKTVAIGEYKAGHFLNDGPDVCGELVKRDIGVVLPPDGGLKFTLAVGGKVAV